eukprot:TRINITY_DN3220_c1_g2_i1.p1 TRINITY_DN3220_c1_g2~~TRINITY_DN3220_c1_g2_i1.p1  ORF type:complete len:110 (-),score=24.91 TRINITY_DN3220_c1_g2_i1:165-494(-)
MGAISFVIPLVALIAAVRLPGPGDSAGIAAAILINMGLIAGGVLQFVCTCYFLMGFLIFVQDTSRTSLHEWMSSYFWIGIVVHSLIIVCLLVAIYNKNQAQQRPQQQQQ